MTRVLVCGSRNWTDYYVIHEVLSGVHRTTPITMIIEGGALGADRFARYWAQAHDVDFLTFEADWKTLGRSAGPIRNRQMITEGKPDRVVAFPLDGPGTANMIAQAKKAGLAVLEITE